MSRAVITKSLLTAIANAIRAKTGKSAAMTPAQMATEIADIPAGDDGSLQAAIGFGGGTINYYGEEIRPYALYYAGFNNSPYSANGPITLRAPNAITVDDYALSHARVTDLYLPAVESLRARAIESAHFSEHGTHIVDLPAVTALGEGAFYSAYTNSSYADSAYQIRLAALRVINSANTFSSAKIADISQIDDQQPTNTIYLYVPALRAVTGQRAFYGCSQLNRVNLPYVTNLSTSAFEGSYGIKVANVNALTAVPSRCFYGCWQLPRIDLYAAASIGSMAFYNCQQLTALVIHKTDGVVTLQNKDAFTQSAIAGGTGYIYVPDDLVATYKEATNWATYAAQIKPLSEYTEE